MIRSRGAGGAGNGSQVGLPQSCGSQPAKSVQEQRWAPLVGRIAEGRGALTVDSNQRGVAGLIILGMNSHSCNPWCNGGSAACGNGSTIPSKPKIVVLLLAGARGEYGVSMD